jgi:hypothetical protein
VPRLKYGLAARQTIQNKAQPILPTTFMYAKIPIKIHNAISWNAPKTKDAAIRLLASAAMTLPENGSGHCLKIQDKSLISPGAEAAFGWYLMEPNFSAVEILASTTQ